jgi:hypothetical protein
MPIANILKSSFVILIGSVCGYKLMKAYNENAPVKQNRYVASTVVSKIGKEQVSRQFFDLQTDNQIAKDDSSLTELKIIFIALKDLNAGLQYKWSLPAGVNVLSGSVQEQLPAMKSGETKEIVLKVTGFSKELRKYVSLDIDGTANQFPVRRSVLISSRIEDSLEYRVQQTQLKEINNGDANKLGTKKTKFAPENIVR